MKSIAFIVVTLSQDFSSVHDAFINENRGSTSADVPGRHKTKSTDKDTRTLSLSKKNK